MFAKKRLIRLGNATELKTPILLPSFSSKGFPKVQKILKACEEYIADEILVSAYDISYGVISPEFDFASAVFLDSGGYEASKDSDLSEIYEGDHVAKDWSAEKYAEVVRNWACPSPTVFVSFDHPKHRTITKEQIDRARTLILPPGEHARSILLKPESETAIRLHLEKITPHIPRLKDFSVVGVTEKEIGNSILSRMVNVARLRKALDSDIDSLLILKGTGLEREKPSTALTKVADIVRTASPTSAAVGAGRLAVTVQYSDGMQIQLLPAFMFRDGLKVPSFLRDDWSRISPEGFQRALSSRNQECGGKLIPTIKLAKAIIGNLPEKQRLSGYHIESLAIAGFKGYLKLWISRDRDQKAL